jgi:hypothetical protein
MRTFPIGVVAACAAAVLANAAPAQAATPIVQFTKAWYDSPGPDFRSNASLNAEYVVLKNTTNKALDLEGWILRDETGYKYVFGDVTLKPGKKITIRSGQGTDTTTNLYWGRRQYVWNNDGDTATLRNVNGKKIDACGWSGGKPGFTNC